MTLDELEARVKTLEEGMRTLQDIEEIKRLQRIYGYYLEHWMTDELVDLFSDDPDASCEFTDQGVFVGKQGIRRYFETMPVKPKDPRFLHAVMQIGGVVDVDPGGKTAKGRWYGWGVIAGPREEGTYSGWLHGRYVCVYVKENGKWKIKNINFYTTFRCPYAEGWVKNPLPSSVPDKRIWPKPDRPTTVDKPYPSGYIVPFHFKHPITGK
jgi:hypothetical protein